MGEEERLATERGGLRERKKQNTRRAIAAAAMRLFREHGFDRVTVAQIATEADVADKTVYNYFPAKTDLFFDERDDILVGLLDAVHHRSVGESVLAAVRDFHAGLPRRLHGSRPARPSRSFRQLIDESPTLQAARREMFARYEHELAAVLAEETGTAPDAIEPFVVAVALVGVLRSGFERGVDTTNPTAVQVEQSRRATRAFELLDKGLTNYGR